jgi:membrane-associated phospholipid phosphatase
MNLPPQARWFSRLPAAVAAIALFAASAGTAHAAEPAAPQPSAVFAQPSPPQLDHQLVVNLPVDVTVTAVGAGVWIGSELLKSHLAPLECRWCEANDVDLSVRSALRWTDHGGTAITLSNVGAYVLAPAAAFGLVALAAAHDGRSQNTLTDLLIIAQAAVLAGDLNQLVKFSVGRQRPYAHAGVPNPDHRQGPEDANLSFYSGHTNFTFAVAAAAATVGHLRGYRWAPAALVAGVLIAGATGYLRIAADQHYLTDVLAGAAAGTAIGVAVPMLHRPCPWATGETRSTSVALAPASFAGGGRGVGLVALW